MEGHLRRHHIECFHERHLAFQIENPPTQQTNVIFILHSLSLSPFVFGFDPVSMFSLSPVANACFIAEFLLACSQC